MSHEKLYGRTLYTSNNYHLKGPFWDGFRSIAKYFIPFYVLFFAYIAYSIESVTHMLIAMVLCGISSFLCYQVWRRGSI